MQSTKHGRSALGLIAALGAIALAAASSDAHAQSRVPIIFLPGIGGSVLAEKANPQKVYFGGVKQAMDQFAKLELPVDRAKDKLVSVDILRSAQLARGTYVDQYNLVINRLATLGYKEGADLFVFHYDWRRSNFESADRLRQFIADKGLAGRPIDLIGHSMGGLVSTIYIQKYAGEQKVRNFIAMGTPFFGAVKAIRSLAEGFAVFGVENFLVVSAGSEGTVYRVFASMDSIYELLPTYYDCCYTRASDSAPMQQINLAGSDLAWERFNMFLKGKTGAPAAPGFLDRMRRNIVDLRRLVDLPMPPNVRFHVVVSTAVEDTLIQFLGAKRGVGKPVWGVGKFAGDGTVATISALGRAAKENVIESKREHQFIFDDDSIWPKLRAILLQ
jgi:pimeloyl-ACP methyl ester carboxylesterase